MWNSTPLGLGNGLTGELPENFLLSLPFCKTEVKRPVGEQSKMDLSAFLCWILISNESCWKSNDHPVCKNRTFLPEDCKWLSPWSRFPGRIWILHTWRTSERNCARCWGVWSAFEVSPALSRLLGWRSLYIPPKQKAFLVSVWRREGTKAT